jgi:hypothetical protein
MKMASYPAATREVRSKSMTEFYLGTAFDAQIEDAFNFPVQGLLGKPVFGNAVSDHAAQLGHGFKYGHVVAHPAKEKGAAQTGGSPADDGDPFAGGRRHGNGIPFAGIHLIISGKAFQLVDGDRFIFHPRRQKSSQGWGQTLPQESSSGLRSRMVWTAPHNPLFGFGRCTGEY